MTIQSFIFDFHRVPRFFEDWNNNFSIGAMKRDNSSFFQVVYCSIAPDNIEDCLNGGVLDTGAVSVSASVDLSLKYDKEVISVGSDCTWNVGANVIQPIKAVFIRNKSNGYVMGYSIFDNAIEVTNVVKLEKDTILWSIVDG